MTACEIASAVPKCRKSGPGYFAWRHRKKPVILRAMRTPSMARREFLTSGAILLSAPALAQRSPQRTVVVMCDGFGVQYLEQSEMPVLARWREQGVFARVKDAMP